MIKLIELSKIVPGTNIRNEKDSSVYELAKSINERGLLQPICVRDIGNGMFEIISGHRRFEAVKINNDTHIMCNILEASDKDRLILQMVENSQRKDMSAYELVQVFDEMKSKYHCTNKQLAHYFSKNEQWVNDNYCAVRILEREYQTGEIPVEKKKMTAGKIKKALNKKREGNTQIIDCAGFSVVHKGHKYNITCNNFEAEKALNAFIAAYKVE